MSKPLVLKFAAKPVLTFKVVAATVVPVNAANVPAAAAAPPITTPSIVPEFMSIPVTGVVPSRRSSVLSQLPLR